MPKKNPPHKEIRTPKPARTNARRAELMEAVLTAGRESGTRGILFQQAVGHSLGLNASDMKCLDVIALSGPATPSQLAQLTGLTSGSITVLVDRLVEAGLVERRADPQDRRSTQLVPTRKAIQRVAPLYAGLGRAMGELYSRYSDEQLELFVEHFKRVQEIFRGEMSRLGKRRSR